MVSNISQFVVPEDWVTDKHGAYQLLTVRTFSYGVLEIAPYDNGGYGFVTIPKENWDLTRYHHSDRIEDTTFIVPREFATAYYVRQFLWDVEKWREIAVSEVDGNWCPILECLWKDTPVYTHQFPDGEIVYYGMSKTPHPQKEGEYLWYIVFPKEGNDCVIVPEEVLVPNFMDRMGSTNKNGRWTIIAWSHPGPGLCSAPDAPSGNDPRIITWQNDLMPQDIYYVFKMDSKYGRSWKK